jgi:hypothetical protein
MREFFYKTPEQGSRTIFHAATSPKLEGKGGTYLSNCFERQIRKSSEEYAKLFEFTCALLKIKTFGNSL